MDQTRLRVTGLRPSFTSHYRAICHPAAGPITRRVHAYFLDNWIWPSEEAKTKFLQSDIDKGPLFVWPEGREDRVEVLTLLTCFWAFFDDALGAMSYAQAKAVVARTLGMLNQSIKPDKSSRLELILDQICSRLLSLDSDGDGQGAREILKHTSHWIEVAANKERRLKASQDFESYIQYRQIDVGCGMFFYMMCWSRNVQVSDRMKLDPTFCKLMETTGMHIALTNDLYSYPVEEMERQAQAQVLGTQNDDNALVGMCNGVFVLMKENGVDAKEAMDDIGQRRLPQLEKQFEELSMAMTEHYSDTPDELRVAESIVDGCKNLMGGNCEWSKFCGRYNRF